MVDVMHLTHQALSAPLRALVDVCHNNKNLSFKFNFMLRGCNFELSYIRTRGTQESPFEDELFGQDKFVITNLNNQKTISFGDLVPLLIERYGFYEGNTEWRVEPSTILEVFDCLYHKPQAKQISSHKNKKL